MNRQRSQQAHREHRALVSFGFVLPGLSMLLAAAWLAFAAMSPATAHAQDFCWRESYGRGVGEVPASCAAGQEMLGLLCYDVCPAGMKRVGVDCHTDCPAGMRDDGLFCRMAEYGRGAGYAWEFGDALNNDGMLQRCKSQNGSCEMCGLIAYPNCAAGYETAGCNICRPKTPDCSALGMVSGFDLSCGKTVKVGAPKEATCSPMQQKDVGLCYARCASGYTGVGPVCWGQPPATWSECGMGAAKDSVTCGSVIFSQVSSVGQMALFVASLGSSSAASGSLNSSANASKISQKFSQLKTQFQNLKETNTLVQGSIATMDAANKGRKGYVALNTLEAAQTPEDQVRAAAQMASILDPTGVAATIAAYTYPLCSKYFKPENGQPKPQPSAQPNAPAPTGLKWQALSARGKPVVSGAYAEPYAHYTNTGDALICRGQFGSEIMAGAFTTGTCRSWAAGTSYPIYDFEILTNTTDTLVWTPGPVVPVNAVNGDSFNGQPHALCRAKGQGLAGVVVSNKCQYDGQKSSTDFDVLTLVSPEPKWVAGPKVPSNVLVAAPTGQDARPICRVGDASQWIPGELVANKCVVSWNKQVLSQSDYQVLTAGSTPLRWTTGPSTAANPVIGGNSGNQKLSLCRASVNGVTHAGYFWFGGCDIVHDNKPTMVTQFEVLVPSSSR